MEEKPWWAYACEIVIFACATVLLLVLLTYSDGPDSPHMPISSSTAGLVAVCIGFGLITWLVARFVTGKHGGLVGWIADIFSWWV